MVRKSEAPKTIARGTLFQMPYCCGIVVSCNASVSFTHSAKGIGDAFHRFRLEIAKQLGYSYALCTDQYTNTAQRKILAKNHWKDLDIFTNRRSYHKVAISGLNLLTELN